MKKHFSALAAMAALCALPAAADVSVRTSDPTSVAVKLEGDSVETVIDFYGPNVFRLFRDPSGSDSR